MSLYPQSYYGQHPYGGPSYPAPAAQAGYQYQYPPQPSHPPAVPTPHSSVHLHIDPASFRRDYSHRLGQLQINSRPVIQELSFYAQEYARYADIVAQCIESHIRKVPPWMKLPAWYLLDAISKNVFEPYARVFASFVIPLFLETYRAVDGATRSKMDEMLLTWRTGSPAQKELFGLAPQLAIERGIWGDQAGPAQVTKPQVMSELNFALQGKERAIQANPNDTTSKHHVQILLQLRNLVEAGVSQEELTQILSQLRTLVRPSTVPPPPVRHVPQQQWSLPQPQMSYSAYSSNPTANPSFPSTASGVQANSTPIISSQPATEVASTSNNEAHLNISQLLSTLVKSGVVSATTAENASAPDQQMVAEEKVEKMHLSDRVTVPATDLESRRDYRKRILAQNVILSTNDILQSEPAIQEFLYDQLSLQCQQCGLRFPDSSIGKKNLENHLDMHFRQNRKMTENLGRGHSRSWFVNVEDWIHEPGDRKGIMRPPKVGIVHKDASKTGKAEREAELKSHYVVVPTGDEAKPISCPICKEILKSEFLEDEEEWVWKNAVKKDERVYHATCHAEAAASTSNLVARLKNEIGTGSRGSTPDVLALRSTPPPVRVARSRSPSLSPASKLAGTKRKVQHDDQGEVERTPPLKKMALSLQKVNALQS